MYHRAEAMAQLLRVLAALPGGPVQFLAPQSGSQTSVTPEGNPTLSLLWFLRTPGTWST